MTFQLLKSSSIKHSHNITHKMPSLRLNNTQINGSRRFIHILQSPTTSLPPPSQDSSKFIKNVDEISADIASTKTTIDGYSTAIETAAASHTAFKVIGNPGNLLQVSLPASTPLYARRRSLLAALTPSLSSSSSSSSTTTTSTSPLSLISNIQFSKHFFTKLVTGQFPLAFQKFTATEPVSILLSSSISSSPSTILPNQTTSVFTGASVSLNQSPPSPPLPIAIISLDGTLDWTLTNSASLFAYSPLSSSLFFLPSYKQRNTKITGRGILAITPKSSAAASSSVFKVVLQENESLLVAKNSLLAYSLDAQDSKPFVQPTLEKIGSSITDIKPEEAAEVEETVEEALSTTTDDKKKNKGLSSQATLDTVKSLAKSVYSSSLAKWDQLSSPYLRVYGPTTILLNSSSLSSVAGASVSSSSSIAMFWSNLTSSNLFFSIIDNILAVALKLFKVSSSLVMQTLFNKPSLETQVSKLLLEDYKLKQQQKKIMPGSHPKNFLKIARVGPDGKVTIESTDSFKEFL